MKSEINHAIREMAKSVSGGHAAVAAVLGYTKPALENRLYEVKGQRIGIDEAMLIQRISGRTDFAEAVASESGGVFVPLPEDVSCAALAEEEISARFLNIMERGGEMVRKDRSGNRLEQIAGTYVGCLIAVSGAFWVVLVDRLHGGLAPVVAVCILSGSLGRYATGARFERERRSGWLIAWLTFYAYIGGLVLVFVIGPPYLLKAFVWVFGVALMYGVVAGLTDLAARSLKGCRVAISLAVVPHCALGVISYAAALFLS